MEQFINSASSDPVLDGVRSIKSHLVVASQLIDPTNRLLADSKTAITNHLNGTDLLTATEVNTYLASTMLLHSLDGWTYLSHAIDSLLKGDQRIAIHLAYYSELRAAMSFLSSEGIGIFNQNYISVDAVFALTKLPKRDRITTLTIDKSTHKFIWNALDKWIKSISKPSAANDIFSIFSVEGKTFNTWIDNFPYASPHATIIVLKKWLSSWNFEVGYFADDREARNLASYQPPQLHPNPNVYTINENIDKLYSFWHLIEPGGSNRFQLLDQYLLRDLLKMIYSSLTASVKARHTFKELVEKTMVSMGLTVRASFVDFLTALDEHDIFTESLNTAIDPVTNSLNPISVIARATLMLRIATGNTSYIYTKGGITKSELDFLWESYGVENGFWSLGNTPADLSSLWDDIKDELEEVNDWANARRPGLDLSSILQDSALPYSLNYFTQFNRAGLWGLL